MANRFRCFKRKRGRAGARQSAFPGVQLIMYAREQGCLKRESVDYASPAAAARTD
jgi:hypothetical protein